MGAAAFLASVVLLLPFVSLSRDVGAEAVQQSASSLVRDEIRIFATAWFRRSRPHSGLRHSRPQPCGREGC